MNYTQVCNDFQDLCVANGGYLVEFGSELEEEFIKTEISLQKGNALLNLLIILWLHTLKKCIDNKIYFKKVNATIQTLLDIEIDLTLYASREKERDLTQSYNKNPSTNRKFENQWTTQKRDKKLQLHNDCGPT